MAGGVVYLMAPEGLIVMQSRPYELEDVLQGLLAGDARLLGGASTGDAATRRWILIRRENLVHGASGQPWSADHLFVDHEGVPTIVEVKRGANTQIRREIVGQLLDYLSNLADSTSAETMRSRFEERMLAADRVPEDALRDDLQIDVSADEFWALVKENLTSGRIRGYFVADEVPEELRRIVDYLNRQIGESRFLALEVRQFQTDDGGTTTLVPQIVAGSLEPPSTASTRGRTEAEGLHLAYWTAFETYLRDHGVALPMPKPAGRSLNYLPLGRKGFRLCVWNLVVRANSGVELVITEPNASEHLERIRAQYEARIAADLSAHGTVVWQAKSADMAQVFIQRDDLPLTDSEGWPQLQAWMAETLVAMDAVFRPIVRDLDG